MDVVERLRGAFMNCEKLQRHIRFLYTKGSLYKVDVYKRQMLEL